MPDHTTLSRRQADLAVDLPPQRTDQPLHLVVDSTGLKVYGEGEWKVRQHGWTKRRTWRKLHLGVNEATGEIVAQTLTTNRRDDASQVEPLLQQVEASVAALGGDGAYDTRKVFDALAAPDQGRPIRPIIPPRKDAKIEQHGNTKAEPLPRDETIRAIRKRGRRGWKNDSGYPRRSIAETQMSRYKQILGDTLRARTLPNLTNRPKHGWVVRCLTDCSRWPNPSPIRLQKKRKPKNQEANTADPVSCNKADFNYQPSHKHCQVICNTVLLIVCPNVGGGLSPPSESSELCQSLHTFPVGLQGLGQGLVERVDGGKELIR